MTQTRRGSGSAWRAGVGQTPRLRNQRTRAGVPPASPPARTRRGAPKRLSGLPDPQLRTFGVTAESRMNTGLAGVVSTAWIRPSGRARVRARARKCRPAQARARLAHARWAGSEAARAPGGEAHESRAGAGVPTASPRSAQRRRELGLCDREDALGRGVQTRRGQDPQDPCV